MTVKGEKDYLYLVWKDSKSRKQYIIGELIKNGGFKFSYGYEIEEALRNGFQPLISFEDIDKTYWCDMLFPVFSSRLPDKKRRGIERILEKYGLDEYDAYRLLKRSGAKLPIDNLEFIDPIDPKSLNSITRIFYLAGPRHYIGCEGIDCNKAILLEKGDKLVLESEPENKYDRNALKILDRKGNHIGYLPRYYSASVKRLLDMGRNYECEIYYVQKEEICNECIKVKLVLNK